MIIINKEATKPIITINDFLYHFDEVNAFDIQKGISLDFKYGNKKIFHKIDPLIQLAKTKDAKGITQIFNNVYHGTYPYKKLLDVKQVSKMIKESNFEWIIFKINLKNEIVGCLVADLDFKKKKGLIHGFAVKKDFQKIVNTKKALITSVLYLFKKYENKILVWFAEVRTNDTTSQYYGSLCGIKPIAFLPNKDTFLNHIESIIMIITYDGIVLKNYRCKKDPKIIRQILNCYTFSNKRYHLGIPIIENPKIEFEKKKNKGNQKKNNTKNRK